MNREHDALRAWPARARRGTERLLGTAVAMLLLGLMSVTVVDVAGRYLFAQPLPGAFELTEILLAMTIFLGLPLVCLREEHVAVTLLTDRLPARAREVHAAVSLLLGGAVLGVIAWQLLAHGRRLSAYGDVTTFRNLPKAPIAYAMAACTTLAALALLAAAIGHFRRPRSPGPHD